MTDRVYNVPRAVEKFLKRYNQVIAVEISIA
jgi:hypothetical protein